MTQTWTVLSITSVASVLLVKLFPVPVCPQAHRRRTLWSGTTRNQLFGSKHTARRRRPENVLTQLDSSEEELNCCHSMLGSRAQLCLRPAELLGLQNFQPNEPSYTGRVLNLVQTRFTMKRLDFLWNKKKTFFAPNVEGKYFWLCSFWGSVNASSRGAGLQVAPRQNLQIWADRCTLSYKNSKCTHVQNNRFYLYFSF